MMAVAFERVGGYLVLRHKFIDSKEIVAMLSVRKTTALYSSPYFATI